MEEKPSASSSKPNMISPSSIFKPKLNDQDYMELVCENGQIFGKSRRPNNNDSFKNQRKESIFDLYETEYDEGFLKNIKNLEDTQVVPVNKSQQPKQNKNNNEETNKYDNKKINDDSLKGSKSVEVITALPDEQSAAIGRSTKLYFASSSMCSRDLSCYSLKKRKYGDIEEEESTYLNNISDDESDNANTQVSNNTVTKRKRSTEVHKFYERKRRNEFNKKLCALQDLLPNCNYKDDKSSLLDEAIKYMRTLQLQIQMMSMGNALMVPPTMLPMSHYYPMGFGEATTTSSLPQFWPMMNVQGINDTSSQMLSFLNHPIGLIPNSQFNYSPLASFSQQFAMPWCVPQTQATSFTQFPKSASTSNLQDTMQL